MIPEALDVLRNLLAHYPKHPLLLAKVRDIEAMARGDVPPPIDTPPSGMRDSVPLTGHAEQEISATDAIDLDEIEEVDADDLVEVDDSGEPGQPKKRKPTVMLEKPIDDADAATHYDLGLAYKEMGLHDEAIKAFEKVLRAPGREVQCRQMIGMCQRDQGNPSEAIHQFKQGLHAEPTDRERLSLYYEIGVTYESIGDGGEALYYFEAVVKRDASFADAGMRADALRKRVGHSTPPPDDEDL
jgi:tetratricopeptide (TPR) repeat protein